MFIPAFFHVGSLLELSYETTYDIIYSYLCLYILGIKGNYCYKTEAAMPLFFTYQCLQL